MIEEPGPLELVGLGLDPDMSVDDAARMATQRNEACDCPKPEGVIRHQRSSCTDPVVAKLDWYADRSASSPEPAPEPVPQRGCT